MSSGRKIIFLDHHGVMYIKKHPNPGILDFFDENKILLLKKIINTVKDVEIVVSSDWRFWVVLSKMKDFYQRMSIQPPVDYTTHIREHSNHCIEYTRANEIKDWLKKNNNVTHWVAIDDLDMTPYLTNFVKTDFIFGQEYSLNAENFGLTMEKVDKIITYLQ
jgi:hypothetical protein